MSAEGGKSEMALIGDTGEAERRKMLMKYSRETLAEILVHMPSWMVQRRMLESIELANKLRKAKAALLAGMDELQRLDKRAERVNQRVRNNVVCTKGDIKILRDCAAQGHKVDALTKRLSRLLRSGGSGTGA